MRKKSSYKPKGVRLDNMAWVQSSLKKVGTLPTAGLALKLKMHEALAAMLNGTATRSDVDALISAVNVAEALIRVRADLGRDWAVEIKAAQDAIHDMGVRCYKRDKFLFTGPEMSAVKVVVELHDQQLDDCTVREMEQALFIVEEVIRMKKARAIIPVDKQTA
jgi:hypothetical protein